MTKDTQSQRLGRPPSSNPKNFRLSVALDGGTVDALHRKAKKTGKPVSELVRQYVEEGLARG